MIEPYKKKTITRLKQAKGQLEAIIKMVEEDQYCGDILSQMLALQGVIKSVSPLMLESHLHTCAADRLSSKNKQKKQAFINELVQTFSLSSR